MSNTHPAANLGMWRSHLEAALARPNETIILATLDDQRSMAMQTATQRPQDLIDVARSLLDEAMSRLQAELADEDGNDQGDDPREQLVSTLDEVLGLLPDPHADE